MIDGQTILTRQVLGNQRRPEARRHIPAVFLPDQCQHSLPYRAPSFRDSTAAPRCRCRKAFAPPSSETAATAVWPGGSSHPAASPRRPTPSSRPSLAPIPQPASTPVHSSLSVPTATSTVVSLGDISNESPRGHYQRVTTYEVYLGEVYLGRRKNIQGRGKSLSELPGTTAARMANHDKVCHLPRIRRFLAALTFAKIWIRRARDDPSLACSPIPQHVHGKFLCFLSQLLKTLECPAPYHKVD